MTYIEFFDTISIKNICACLTNTPSKVIFIGKDSKQMKKFISRYDLVFSLRGLNIEFTYRTVNESQLSSIIDVLTDIVNNEPECAFDLTGGTEMILVAMGIVYERMKDKKIQMHRFNIRTNTILDCDSDGIMVLNESPALTVEENIQIYGGNIVYEPTKPNSTYMWNLSEDFSNDIDEIWDICRCDVRLWNTQISVLAAADKCTTSKDDPLLTIANEKAIDNYLKAKNAEFVFIKHIFYKLVEKGLLKYCVYKDGLLTLSYKNAQVKRCLTKAGQALEMKVYKAAVNLRDTDGTRFYNDVMNGVYIDWDGSIHCDSDYYDTENEIDNIIMKGIVPIFVSCKNGAVSTNELYKLNTVAERFGGKHSKKVLFATALDSMGEYSNYITQRAEDMRINVIKDIHLMSDFELSKTLKSLWKTF